MNNLHKELVKSVNNGYIKNAIRTAKLMIQMSNLTSESNNLHQIEETYKYMLHYLVEGYKDENRTQLLNKIKEDLLVIADKCYRKFETKENPQYYYSILRIHDYKDENLSDLLREYENISATIELGVEADNDVNDLIVSKERISERLFNSLYTSFDSKRDYEDLSTYIQSGMANFEIASLSISAITLSLMQFFDASKINFLIDIYVSESCDALKAKALLGIIFSMIYHPQRIISNYDVSARLSLLSDSQILYSNLRDTVKALVSTIDTERVTSKMRDEIIPEIIKLRPDITKSYGDQNVLNGEDLESNPEWFEKLEKSGLSEKMRELSDMQSQGADLMMVTFSKLKNFPFFDSAANWFLPFNPVHSSISNMKDVSSLLSVMELAGNNMCDSDKYSFALALKNMPEMQKKIMISQMSAQMEQIKEQMSESDVQTEKNSFANEILKAVRDYYRFFNLFKKRDQMRNPFEQRIDFISLPIFGEILDNNKDLYIIGEFYFTRKLFSEALPLFTRISEHESDHLLYEKIGFCYQKMGDPVSALEYYNRSSLLNPPGMWLMKKLAYVNKLLGNYEAAIGFYEDALSIDSENITLLISIANALILSGRFSDSLIHLYHANYIDPDNLEIIRLLANAEFLNGNLAKSSAHLIKLISTGNADSDAYRLIGHIELLNSNFKEAINYYGIAKEGDSDFENKFKSDVEKLIDAGADRNIIILIQDSLR